jgi:hypothetical protein
MTKCNHDYRFVEKQGDKYLYRCAIPQCAHEVLLSHAEEAIRNKPTEVKSMDEPQTEGTPTAPPVEVSEKVKKQSDYHKRRYQLLKEGKWDGHLKTSQ